MTLNTAQYIAPLNSQQVLSGYAQGVKQDIGVSIAADGTITLDPAGAASIGFIISNNNAAAQYVWPTATGSAREILVTNGGSPGSLSWTGSYVEVYPLTSTFPHLGAAAMPAGDTGNRPAGAVDGWLRYNTDFDFFEFYSTLQNTWLPMSQSTGGVFSFVQAPPGPTAMAAGDIWFNTLENLEYVWDGLAWQPTSPLGSTANPGRLQVGANLNVTTGVVTVPAVAAPAGGVSAIPGVVYLNDTVTSTALDQALTANQGKILQDQISALQIANNLTFAGTIDGVTGNMIYVTPAGFLQGFAPGFPLPASNVANEDYFVIVVGAGSFAPPGSPVTAVTQGDWFLSTGANWQFLNVGYDPQESYIAQLDDISSLFNGVRTGFPLTIAGVGYTPNPTSNLMVFVGGVVQLPGAGNAYYILAGSNISFVDPPPSGATFYATTVIS